MRNRYFICRSGRPPLPWCPAETDWSHPPECGYWGRVLTVVDELVAHGGRTFYLTWDLRFLPSYGPEVVAVVLGDEWFHYPAYLDRVGAVFKTYGIRPPWSAVTAGFPRLPALLSTAELVRTLVRRLPAQLRHHARRAGWSGAGAGTVRHNQVHTVPPGYYHQLELPVVPVEDRSVDVLFAGSVYGKQHGIRKFVHGPKEITRKWMLDRLDQLAIRRPDLNVYCKVTGGFPAQPGPADASEYSHLLMNARICLAPRGTNVETHRLFEALRAGCVVIATPLPRRWFYAGAPVIELTDWRRVDREIERLLADPPLLARLHRQALTWWRTAGSEPQVGSYLASVLDSL